MRRRRGEDPVERRGQRAMRPARSLLVTLAVGVLLALTLVWLPLGPVAPAGLERGPGARAQEETTTHAGAPHAAEPAAPPLELARDARAAAPERATTPADSGGPRGIVLELASDRPLAGLAVRIRRGEELLATTTTDADGRFRLPRMPVQGARVELAADGWRAQPAWFGPTSAQAAGRGELRFLAEHVATAPLRGQLVNERTGELVPDFLLQVIDHGGRSELVRSDARGRFESAGGFEAGPMQLVLLDHAGAGDEGRLLAGPRSVSRVHELGGGAIHLAIPVGPTWRLALELPPGTAASDFFAGFMRGAGPLREQHAARGRISGASLLWMLPDPQAVDELELRAPLRAGERPWVRLRVPLEPPPDGPRELVVRSRDGRWAGVGLVSSFEGVAPALVPVELGACGTLRGRVHDGTGAPIASAWVGLESAAPRLEQGRQVGADEDGAFELGWLPAGEHELLVEAEPRDPWRGRVRIGAFATEELEIELRSSVPLGTISGHLRSTSGNFSKPCVLRLCALDRPDDVRTAMVLWYELGDEHGRLRTEATFAFEEVPEGRYELLLESQSNLPWSARRLVVSPPAEGLELVCDDLAPTYELELRAVDARTGVELREVQRLAWQGAPGEEVELWPDGSTGCYLGVPRGAPLRWAVHAPGYRLARGDGSDAVAEGDRRVVVARLEPGWGRMLQVQDPTGRPLAGVQLLVDGELAGESDRDGWVLADPREEPQRVELRRAGWSSFSWDRALDLSLGAGNRASVVVLQRE